jgi:NlpC/P60 family putative phage cell wall peptidase
MSEIAGGPAEVVVSEALSWVATPYRHQGSRKGVGCDCLGLLLGVWRALHGAAPEAPGTYAPDWAEAGGEDRFLDAARRHCVAKPLAELCAGDLVLFRWRPHLPAKHAGIMVGPDRFVHAYQGSAVVVSALVPQWRRRIAGAFSFPTV